MSAFERFQDGWLNSPARRGQVVFVLEILLIVLLCAVFVRLMWFLVTPLGPIGDAQGVRALQPAARAIAPISDMFWGTAASVPRASTNGWQAHGVLYRPDGKPGGAILSQSSGRQEAFLEGDVVSGDLVLRDVGADFAILSNGGEEITLYLDDAPARPAPVAQPRRSGVQLPGPLDPMLLQGFGLLPGDELLSVNGRAVSSQADVRTLAGSLQSAAQVQIEVRRGDRVLKKVLK